MKKCCGVATGDVVMILYNLFVVSARNYAFHSNHINHSSDNVLQLINNLHLTQPFYYIHTS